MTHHKLGRTRLHNIHDKGNVVALCSICHSAFDNSEWTFVPRDIIDWVQKIKATPQMIEEYNSRRDLVFQRLLLAPDPESRAFQDNHYKSAFTKSPTKIWPGEPGVLILPPSFVPPPDPTADLRKTLDDFGALQELWLTYKNPCSSEECPICRVNIAGNKGSEVDREYEEEEEEEEDDDDGKEGDSEDDEDDEEEDSEDDDGDIEEISSRKKRKGISKKQAGSTGQEAPFHGIGRDWMTSAPYDESIPYSHRYGYTWVGSTANELMALWQLYRRPAHE